MQTNIQPPTPAMPKMTLITPELQLEVEQFLYAEAELLDQRHFLEWTELLADDVDYFMPFKTNRLPQDQDQEIRPRSEGGHFGDNKASLVNRAKKLSIKESWSEYPASRTRHMITNVRIRPTQLQGEYQVESYFHFYRSRGDRQIQHLIGGRDDVLRRVDSPYGFQIVRRTIYLDQSLLMTAGITTFL